MPEVKMTNEEYENALPRTVKIEIEIIEPKAEKGKPKEYYASVKTFADGVSNPTVSSGFLFNVLTLMNRWVANEGLPQEQLFNAAIVSIQMQMETLNAPTTIN